MVPAFCYFTITYNHKLFKYSFFFSHLSAGVLMADEMSTEEMISFNKRTGLAFGMVSMGSATPPGADSVLGDHGLVFLFQPFKGQWFQAIGAFCTRGAAKGPELEKLFTEGIIMLYKSGVNVDLVTTDGGAWNRNMWSLYGINEHQVSCVNPAAVGETEEEIDNLEPEKEISDDEKRKLWFCSDFPHLMKSVWSRVRNSEELEVQSRLALKLW